jgi:uracil-DNA glycosylase family 4
LAPDPLALLAGDVVACAACPRLAAYLAAGRARHPDYWCRPVPGFGDPRARLVVVGLAPGFHGANRTGRPFCTDSSGRWLWRALYETGALPSPEPPASSADLPGIYVTNAVRCAPPGNRPTAAEFAACRPFLCREIAFLPEARVLLALGRHAHDACARLRRQAGSDPATFAHAAVHPAGPGFPALVDSYHPSRQNTQTGRMTWEMFIAVVARAVETGMTGNRRK